MNGIDRFLSLGLKFGLLLSASALPVLAQGVNGACIYALDPTANQAFYISGNTTITANCSVVVESSASAAFVMGGTDTLYLANHAEVGVVGGWQLNGQSIIDTISNQHVQPVTISAPGDPLASVPAPTQGTIVSAAPVIYNSSNPPANNSLSPGVYCGGLTIANTSGMNYTMSPGTYIMAGGGFQVTSSAMVQGTGITVYNTSSAGWGCSGSYAYSPITIDGQASVNLSAPTNGPLTGIVLFGDRNGCATPGTCQDNINGKATATFNGVLYLSGDLLLFNGKSQSSGCMAVVADKITINGDTVSGGNSCYLNPISVSISPQAATLYGGQIQPFTASVTNTYFTNVTWSISPTGAGTIDASGNYTAPANIPQQQMVTVTATSQADNTKLGTATVTLTPPFVKTTPTITWVAPAAITYGTALSTAQLNATASVAGTFAYSPAVGTILTAGSHTLSVTFAPTDTTDYNTATASVTLTVSKATPTISWATPVVITYGTALSATQLNATASVAGTFGYSPASGTVLTAGPQPLSVSFTPTDTTNYNTATAGVTLTVNKATPTITWATPSAIAYGTALSATQLNATASVAGTFSYSPAAGTVLSAGAQALSVAFTPADSIDYSTANASVTLTVNQAVLTITASGASLSYGAAIPVITASYAGFVNGDTAASLATAPTCSTSYTATTSVSVSPVVTNCSGAASSNYLLTYIAGAISITKATPSISAWPTADVIDYGQTVGSSTLSGGTASAAGAFAWITPSATPVAGTESESVIFTPSDPADLNTVTGLVSLTVNKGALTITASSASLSYGSAVPAITASYAGFVNGDTAASLATAPVCSTTYSMGSAVGSYPTACTGAASANYSIGYVAGTVAVTAVNQTITFTGPSSQVNYSMPPIALSATASSGLAVTFSVLSGPAIVSGNTLTITGAGSVVVAADQAGNADYTSAAEVTQTILVNPAPSFTEVTSSLNPSTFGQSVSFSALVSTGGVAPTGGISFSDAGSTIGSATLTPVLTTNLVGFSQANAAAWTSDETGSAAPTVSTDSSADPFGGTNALQMAFPSPGAGISDTLNTVTLSGAFAGQTFTASVLLNAPIPTGITLALNEVGGSAATASNAVTVGTTWQRYSVSLPIPSTDTNASGLNLALINASGQPAATINVFGAQVENAGSEGPYIATYGTERSGYGAIASFNTSSLTPGTHPIDVSYPGDSNNVASTSAPLTQTVNVATPVLSLSSSANSFAYGTPVTFTAAISNGLTGAVTFYDGSTAIGTATLSGGTATLTVGALTAGAHSITATWAGNADYNPATSAVLTVAVSQATPIVTWATPAAITYGTALSSAQLDATANVPGTFAYTPASGTVLTAGSQTLSVSFIPADGTDYSTVTANVVLIVTSPLSVSVTPSSQTLSAGQTQQFTATVSNASDTSVTWAINPTTLGAVDANGLYTAPAAITSLQNVSVTATSQQDNTKSASGTVTLTPISPINGPAGTLVTISGAGFGASEGSSSVTVGGLPAVTLLWNDSQIIAQIPTGTGLGSQGVVVTVGGQVLTNVTFTVLSGLVGITPSSTGTFASTTVNTPGKSAPLIFNGTAGKLVSVQLSNFSFPSSCCNAVTVSILKPDGTTLVSTHMYSAGLSGTVLFQNPVALPTTGIYRVVIAPQNGYTGSTSVALYSFDNQEGTITPGVPTASTISIPGQEELLAFAGSAGQLASVQLSNFSYPGNCCDTVTVSILKPDGSTLVSTQMYSAGLRGSVLFQPAVTLPLTGNYTVVIAPQNGFTGSTNLTLSLFSNQLGTITSGVPVPVANSYAGQKSLLTFNGTAGQLASVLLTNFSYPSSCCDTVTVSIVKPDGTTLVSTNMYSAGLSGTVLFQNPVTLPVTGTYTLVIAPQNGVTGSSTANLYLFNNQVGTITPGISIASTINIPGQKELLTFLGGAGQYANVKLTNFNYPSSCCDTVTVSIVKPDGTTLVSTNMYSAGLSGTVLFQNPVALPTAGTYTLVIAPQNGVTGSATVLLGLTGPKAVTVNASLVPTQSYFGNPVAVNLNLIASNGAYPTGTVSCSGSGVTSAAIAVNANGSATVSMSGLPLGKDSIVCSFTSNKLTSFSNAVSSTLTESVMAMPATGSVSVTPASVVLYGSQVQQFSASVFNTSNQAVTWTIIPSNAGTISSTGFYSAPATVTNLQTVTVKATSQADTTQSDSAIITLSPSQCASSGYGYQRSIVIDHTKVPNTDQTDFPFLFNTADPKLATVANGGHVSSLSGYDIFFSTDPAGLTKLDHELEQYDPVHGQVVAWVRIPTLSHTADTVLYVFYGNPNIASSQQNPSGVWDGNFTSVYHLENATAGTTADSTANGNTATLASATTASGQISGALSFNGTSSYIQIPSPDFKSYPTSGSTMTGFSSSFAVWFRTATSGVILGQTDGTAPGGNPGQWQPAMYVDTAGRLRASLFSHGTAPVQIVTTIAYNDNNWHFAVDTYTNGTEELYVDGQYAGSQQAAEYGYNSSYAYFAGTGETSNWPAANNSWLYLNGALDELNISSIARSSDWIQTQYRNQSSPSTFYALHSENAVEVLPSAVSLYDSQSQHFAVLGSVAGTCSSPAVIWSMPSGMPGTLTASGIYTAPSSITSQQTVPVTAIILGASTQEISATVTLTPALSVSLAPGSVTLAAGQTQQFTANVANTNNTAVSWTISPAGLGVVSAAGLYTAPTAVPVQESAVITATSKADSAQSASATITLSPTPVTPPSATPCSSAGYGFQRVIVIDHTKVPNTDQVNFPFLFNTTDPSLATISNGGQVASSKGYDIIFSSDPGGLTKLDHEVEEYDPVHGQVIAWVRIPNLSHTTDTVLYLFYGNPSITASQQNADGVWDSNYTAVYHLADPATNGDADSTVNGNDAMNMLSISPATGEIDGAGGFNGTSSSIQIPETDFPNFPTGTYNNVGLPNPGGTSTFSTSFGVWFKTASAGGILMQSADLTCTFGVLGICSITGPMQAGDVPDGSWDSLIYVDDNGRLNAGGLLSPNAYNDNKWHNAVWTLAASGGNTLYVDGKSVASGQQANPGGYAPDYAYFVGASYTLQASQGNWDWLYFNGAIDEVTVSDIARSADWIRAEYNNQSSPATFYSFNPANSAQVVPSAINLYASQSQQFAATNSCGSPVAWSMPSGAQGILTTSGLYTAPAAIPSPQTIVITATNQTNGSNIGSSVVTLMPPPQPIALTASSLPPYTSGSSQSFSAAVLDQDGTPEIGITVTFAVVGANNTIGSGTTDSNGVASFSYIGANSGSDTILATAIVRGQAFTSNSVSAAWIVPLPQNPAASVALTGPPALGASGLVGVFTDNSGVVIEPIAIGTAPGTFRVPVGATRLQLGVDSEYFATNGGPGFVVAVNGVSVTVPPTAMPWTWSLGGLNKNYQYGIYNPGIQGGILDGTSPIIAASGLTQGEAVRVVYQHGTASSNYPLAPLVDANGSQTSITGAQLWQGTYYPTLYTTPSSYPVGQPINFNALVTDVTGAPLPNVPVTLNVTGANVQQLQATTDSTGTAAFMYVGSNPGTDSLQAQATPSGGPTLASIQSNVKWIGYAIPPAPGSFQLQLLATVQSRQGYDVLATDHSGNPVFNANVALYAWGIDNFVQTATTDTTGHAFFNYFHVNTGTYNLVAVEPTDRNIVFSNVVTGQWTGPSVSTPGGSTIAIGISGFNSVVFPSALQLNGTVTDSTGLTPTIVWSQVSGPGAVSFTNPNQAVTTVSFSDLGTYVLKLSASDANGNSGSVQWQVQVEPPIQDPQGWIGSPAYGSTVSGIVPITLAPGISLQSGTLVYYPASNSNSVTVLNANTSGSGQIGALDTTMLANGSYWIQLQATNAGGQSEYSLILITVAGNYKPGRVTATVTDLVVPATGLAINIQRSYDSLNAGTSGDFGYGWNLGINTNLTVDPAGNVTFTLGGQRKTFYLAPQFNGFLPYFDVAFSPEPGLYGTLTDSAPGCPGNFDFVLPNGSLWTCVDGGQFSPPGYVYTDPNGTSYTISAAGNLQSISDRSGNGLTITAKGITSTTGLNVPFVRDAQNRITQITDPQGNVYQYGYDSNGNLATVTYPAISLSATACPNTTQPNTSTYTYGANHFYTGGTDGRCNLLPTTAYFGASDTDSNGLPLNGRLKSVQDALAQTTSYAYNLATNTTTVTYPPDASGNTGTATMVYDSYGMLLSSTDPLNHTTTNAYDQNHNLISVTDPLGHVNSYAYNLRGNKISSTYPATATSRNTTSTTAYNQYSEPTSTTDELGNVRLFTYDANYNPKSVADSAGTLASFLFNSDQTLKAGTIGFDIAINPAKSSQFAYDANGNLTGRTDALGRTTSYTYDELGHKTAMVEPTPASLVGSSASTTSYQYDALGNLTQTAAPLGRTTSYTYDANGNKLSDTDARSYTTSYQYDALNRLVLTTYPTSPATTSAKTYDFRGNVVTETDQNSNVTKHSYDLAGRQTSVTRAYGTSNASTTSYTYYDDGRKKSETDSLSHTTNYSYDAAGNLTGVSGVQGTFAYGYDDARNRISMTDGNSHTTGYAYDARKRLTVTTYPDQTTKTNAYDGPGNLASVTDQASNVVQYTYDAANQLKSVVQVNSPNTSANTTSFNYDKLGNLSALADANSHTTQDVFDQLREMTGKTLPDGTLTESRNYDNNGNLTSLTHFNGVTTTYTYDALNRLLSRTTPGEAAVSFTYTPTGKYASSTAGDGTTTYGYDSLDRLTTKTTPEGTLSYTYDAAGHVASIQSSNAGGANVSYTYDTLNRLSTVVDSRLGTTSYTYDGASNVAMVTYPNNVQTQFNYDTLNRISALATQQSGYTYQRGPTGNITSANELSNRTINWSYDGIYRLTGETVTADPNHINGSVSYGLDPVGNRLSENSSLSGVSSGGFGYNADDQVNTESYDQNGNVVATGGKGFTYDSQNQMMSMTTSGTAASMVYDAFGNRVAKTVNGVTTHYLVDDLNPTGYAQVVDELAGSTVTRTYTYGLQRISQNQIISNTWTPSFYGYDGGGNVRQLTNSAGVVTDTYDYDAFGNKINSTGSTPNNMLYRGEELDPDLGLYYLRARYMNPLSGRFMSRDPEDGNATDPRTLHKYLYAGGDPADRVDPTGRAELVLEAMGDLWEATKNAVVAVATGAAIACAYFKLDSAFTQMSQNQVSFSQLYSTGPCTFGANNPCPAIEKQIEFLIGLVTRDNLNLLMDVGQQYCFAFKKPPPPGYSTTWEGHIEAFLNDQRALRNVITLALANHCKIPPAAWALAFEPPPICPAGRIPKP